MYPLFCIREPGATLGPKRPRFVPQGLSIAGILIPTSFQRRLIAKHTKGRICLIGVHFKPGNMRGCHRAQVVYLLDRSLIRGSSGQRTTKEALSPPSGSVLRLEFRLVSALRSYCVLPELCTYTIEYLRRLKTVVIRI